MHTCISSHRLKRSWRSCPRRVNAGNKITPSTHHPRRRNVTTLMVGLKNGHIRKNLTQKVVNPRDIAGERKKKKKSAGVRLCIYLYVYVHVSVCVCVCERVGSVSVHIRLLMYVVRLCLFMSVCMCVCMCVYVCVCVCVYVCMFISVMCMYVCVYVCEWNRISV